MKENLDRPIPVFYDPKAKKKTLYIELSADLVDALTEVGNLPNWMLTKNKAAVLILDQFLQEAARRGLVKWPKGRKP